ncbi:UPF0553 protein [Yarrowia sp. C11]|nr:UPF0553 protein [Yarrowia sp. E02]KAG5369738.1 UPF0553 protein [Yarrowia sp. C11]
MVTVLETVEYVSNNADHVTVNVDACVSAAGEILANMKTQSYSTKTWNEPELTPKTKNQETVDWIFLVDLLNFSFWSDTDLQDSGLASSQRITVSYKDKEYTGYWSLCAAINRALDEGIHITSPLYWFSDDFSLEKLAHVFRSSTKESVPLLEMRYEIMKHAGGVFADKKMTSFAQILDENRNKSAMTLVETVASLFPSFKDEAVYKNKNIHIYKRAQILVADIWACFDGEGYGEFVDIDKVTMFADYRVPQILHDLGCLKYSEELYEHIAGLKMLESGDPREVELRACSIWAVELVRREMVKRDVDTEVNAILIDFFLWDTAKKNQQKDYKGVSVQCHRTRSCYY